MRSVQEVCTSIAQQNTQRRCIDAETQTQIRQGGFLCNSGWNGNRKTQNNSADQMRENIFVQNSPDWCAQTAGSQIILSVTINHNQISYIACHSQPTDGEHGHCHDSERLANNHSDQSHIDDSWNIALLRYFNPIGAHESGEIGEDPQGIPNNLLPYVAKVAVGELECINVFGDDYATPDGTGVRDYIHVVDLAIGHIKALEKLQTNPGIVTYNLGTGVGYSVLDIIHNFEKACGKKLPYKITDRRPGDAAMCYSNPAKAEKELGWKAERGIDKMCEDAWRWQSKNPKGYNK